jgi:hypothetical protein
MQTESDEDSLFKCEGGHTTNITDVLISLVLRRLKLLTGYVIYIKILFWNVMLSEL